MKPIVEPERPWCYNDVSALLRRFMCGPLPKKIDSARMICSRYGRVVIESVDNSVFWLLNNATPLRGESLTGVYGGEWSVHVFDALDALYLLGKISKEEGEAFRAYLAEWEFVHNREKNLQTLRSQAASFGYCLVEKAAIDESVAKE